MDNKENELEHDSIFREDFISDIHYYNEIEFYNEFDELIREYEFLLDIENYWEDIPTDTAERFEMLKNSSAQYYNLRYQREYKDLTLRNIVKTVVDGLFQECMLMINDPKLSVDNPEYSTVFLNATRFIDDFVAHGRASAITKYSQRDVETYLYLLHREEYFKIFPLPDEAFDVNGSDKSYGVIAKVYARYFKFKDFIEPIHNQLNKDEKNDGEIIRITNRYHRDSANNREETRKITDIIPEQYRDKYNKVFQILSEKNPLATVADKLKLNKKEKSELLRFDNDLILFQKKFVIDIKEGDVYVDGSIWRIQTFLTYLFAYMYNMNWIVPIQNKLKVTDQSICKMIGNSIHHHDSINDQFIIDRGQFTGIRNNIKRQKLHNNFYINFIELLTKCI